MIATDDRAPARTTNRAERLVHVSDDGSPLADADQVSDLLTGGLGWSHGGVRPATNAEIATATAKPASLKEAIAGQGDHAERARYWWMVRLPAVIEQTVSEFEGAGTHYYAAIWTHTWGTTVARVEVAMTW